MRFGESTHARRRRARRTARRCPARRAARRASRDASASAFVVPSAAGASASPPVGNGAGEREQVARGHARQVGVDDEERRRARRPRRPRRAPRARPRPGRAAGRRRASRPPSVGSSGVTTNVGPTATQAATTSASIARASAARAAVVGSARRLLPSAPRKGTTSVGIARSLSRRVPAPARRAQAGASPGERGAHSRRSNQCEARSASATCGLGVLGVEDVVLEVAADRVVVGGDDVELDERVGRQLAAPRGACSA